VKTELKKHCISFMSKGFLDRFRGLVNIPISHAEKAPKYPEINFSKAFEDAKQIQFFEQAFEWEQVMYKFYPYFWSPKDKWIFKMDQDSNDPRFGEFLRAGAARVVLAVRQGYEEAVSQYFQTGRLPEDQGNLTFENSLFVDIIDELREEQATGLGTVTETWEVSLPTNLVILDDDDAISRVNRIMNKAEE
ncbi:MAG: hypothetical protein AAF570_28270, partial [Bacteroidota bacterium]